jgi:hypothetical protein
MLQSRVFGVILLASLALGHTFLRSGDHESTRYPILVRAELPLYPPIAPIARVVHITGIVEINVTVEKGSVVNAEVNSVTILSSNSPPLTTDGKTKLGLYLSEPSLANLKTWQFQSESLL